MKAKTFAGALILAFAATGLWGQIGGLPRDESLIIQNPEGIPANPGCCNLWWGCGGGLSTGLHQLAFDTFWYIDPNAGVDGVIHNSLAAGPPEYNDDFSEMTVYLRQGIYWSDGVEFTSADVVYTVESQIEHPGAVWSGAFSTNVESVQAIDDYTVRFILKKPNSRFQSVFSVRWNAAWIIPKHIFEKEDPTMFEFNPPVSLGPYTLHSYDPNGSWHIWERRPDWERTTVAEFGMPAPRRRCWSRRSTPTPACSKSRSCRWTTRGAGACRPRIEAWPWLRRRPRAAVRWCSAPAAAACAWSRSDPATVLVQRAGRAEIGTRVRV